MKIASVWRDIIQTDYFRVVVVDDVDAVEVCGALKVEMPFIYMRKQKLDLEENSISRTLSPAVLDSWTV